MDEKIEENNDILGVGGEKGNEKDDGAQRVPNPAGGPVGQRGPQTSESREFNRIRKQIEEMRDVTIEVVPHKFNEDTNLYEVMVGRRMTVDRVNFSPVETLRQIGRYYGSGTYKIDFLNQATGIPFATLTKTINIERPAPEDDGGAQVLDLNETSIQESGENNHPRSTESRTDKSVTREIRSTDPRALDILSDLVKELRAKQEKSEEKTNAMFERLATAIEAISLKPEKGKMADTKEAADIFKTISETVKELTPKPANAQPVDVESIVSRVFDRLAPILQNLTQNKTDAFEFFQKGVDFAKKGRFPKDEEDEPEERSTTREILDRVVDRVSEGIGAKIGDAITPLIANEAAAAAGQPQGAQPNVNTEQLNQLVAQSTPEQIKDYLLANMAPLYINAAVRAGKQKTLEFLIGRYPIFRPHLAKLDAAYDLMIQHIRAAQAQQKK